MKKIIYCFLILFFCQNVTNAQNCNGNLLVNPSFSSGFNLGWYPFDNPAPWIESSISGCIDTFILLGSGSSFQGAIAQNVAITGSACYDLCLCMSSDQNCRVYIFAASSDTSLTGTKFRYKTYNPSFAELIDSFDVSGNPASYCKKGWSTSKNYSRIIVLNTPQPGNGGAELNVDNVCLTKCASPCDSLKTSFTFHANGLVHTFTNATTYPRNNAPAYSWNFGNGNTSAVKDPVYSYPTDGTYKVCLNASLQVQSSFCKDSFCKSILVSGFGIAKQYFETLKISNSSEMLSVTFDQQQFDCEIMEISGKVVRRFDNVSEVHLSNNNFSSGMYIIRITKGGMVYCQRLVF